MRWRRGATRLSQSAGFSQTTLVRSRPARLGLGCVLVQEHWVDWPDVVYDKVGNILLSRIMGADVRLSPGGFDIGIRESWAEALDSVQLIDTAGYSSQSQLALSITR
jgi:1-aminocyclopropane-1-carboxylate deaminase